MRIKTSDITKAKKAIAKRMNSSAAKKARIHVISQKSKWAVIMEGSQRAYKVYPTQEGAVKSAKHLVENGLKKRSLSTKRTDLLSASLN